MCVDKAGALGFLQKCSLILVQAKPKGFASDSELISLFSALRDTS